MHGRAGLPAPLGDPGVMGTPSLDLARDGTGGGAFLRGGVLLYAPSRGGRFGAPVPVAPGAPADASAPVLAAGDGGLAVAWSSGAHVLAAYRGREVGPSVRRRSCGAETGRPGRPRSTSPDA